MVGNKLKEHRVSCGLTQQQLATKILVSRSTISKYECDKCRPNHQHSILLCLYLNLPFEFLCNTDTIKTKRLDIFSTEEKEVIISLVTDWLKQGGVRLSRKEISNYALFELQDALRKSLYTEIKQALVCEGGNAFWICPNCKCTFEREYQSYCDRCGQRLKWPSLRKIDYIPSKLSHKKI